MLTLGCIGSCSILSLLHEELEVAVDPGGGLGGLGTHGLAPCCALRTQGPAHDSLLLRLLVHSPEPVVDSNGILATRSRSLVYFLGCT